MKETDLMDRLPNALQACLANVPNTRLETTEREVVMPNGIRTDLVFGLRILGRQKRLLVEARGSGQPRQAREAVEQLRRAMEDQPQGAYPVFAAPFVSEASAAICRESETGYFDLAGNCRLALDDSYVEVRSPENPFRERRSGISLFSPKSSRILRVLLNEPRREWRVQQLASAAGVSIGLASKIKRQLEEREWAKTEEGGVRLTQPDSVLQAWASAYGYKQNEVFEYYTLETPGEAETAVADWCRESGVEYALTGFSGARLSSPRVRYNRASIYVSARIEDLAMNTRLKRVDSGGNTLLLRPYDDGVFDGARDLYGLRVVSPVQLYLDLKSMAGRGEEAAEEILIRELRPTW